MKSYEGLFIFAPEATPDVRKEQVGRLEALIQKFSGSITQKNEWGKKLLGYSIRKFREGYFLLVDFQMDSLKTNEFRKALELHEEVMKYTVIAKLPRRAAVEAKPAAPAPHHPAAGDKPRPHHTPSKPKSHEQVTSPE